MAAAAIGLAFVGLVLLVCIWDEITKARSLLRTISEQLGSIYRELDYSNKDRRRIDDD